MVLDGKPGVIKNSRTLGIVLPKFGQSGSSTFFGEPRTEPTVFGQNRTGTGTEPLRTGSACSVLVLEPVRKGEL